MGIWKVILICLVIHQGVLCDIQWTKPANGNAAASNAVNERITTAQTVETVEVTGGTGTYTYSLTTQDSSTTTGNFLFNFDGAILKTKANSHFDSSTKSSYVLIFTVSDTTSTATGTLTVSVMAPNNSPPIFNPVSYCQSVQENAPTGTTVGTFTATDGDTMDRLTYSIEGHDGKFSVSNTGKLTTMGSFDKAKTANYILSIKATDTKATATATVTVLLDKACPGSKKNGGEQPSQPFVVLLSCLIASCLICFSDSFELLLLQ